MIIDGTANLPTTSNQTSIRSLGYSAPHPADCHNSYLTPPQATQLSSPAASHNSLINPPQATQLRILLPRIILTLTHPGYTSPHPAASHNSHLNPSYVTPYSAASYNSHLSPPQAAQLPILLPYIILTLTIPRLHSSPSYCLT